MIGAAVAEHASVDSIPGVKNQPSHVSRTLQAAYDWSLPPLAADLQEAFSDSYPKLCSHIHCSRRGLNSSLGEEGWSTLV